MFAAGIGQMDAGHRRKGDPKRDMLVVKLGGPAYRIGIGGGAASSLAQGDNKASLDFNAVQRCERSHTHNTHTHCVCSLPNSGDAEMEQKVNRVIRTCIELGVDNPIISIHDQGAGGNANVWRHTHTHTYSHTHTSISACEGSTCISASSPPGCDLTRAGAQGDRGADRRAHRSA